MFSTSGANVSLWGGVRIRPTSKVLGCKTISSRGVYPMGGRGGNQASGGQKIAHPYVPESVFLGKNVVADSITEKLRQVQYIPKSYAYTPMLVSIGPYHLQNPNLCEMNEHKVRYLHSLLERKKDNTSLESCISELKKLEDKARECYADPIGLNSHEFVEMMLLDGCFVIEFVHRGYLKYARGKDIDDPIFNVNGMEYQIRRDIMLLENQLPYFVLSTLYNMTKDPKDEGPFMEMAMPFFTRMFLKPGTWATM